MTNPNDTYTSPLSTRNASKQMQRIWSARHKFNTWRRIWLAVARSQHRLSSTYVNRDNFPMLVTKEQISELESVVERGISDQELQRATEIEVQVRHDVMSHVHCLGEQCPKAKPIIHLGCTSQDIVCNADWIVQSHAGWLLQTKAASLVITLGTLAENLACLPTTGFTHYQTAQPLTVGRRFAQYGSELNSARLRLGRYLAHRLPRGMKGATGTQASFLALFGDDHTAVSLFEDNVIASIAPLNPFLNPDKIPDVSRDDLGQTWRLTDCDFAHGITSQTYPRVEDTFILSDLASIASVLHKIATDIRLLSNRKELDEPFGASQIGSSAMPYKRNPMRCERICGLTRFVMNLVGNAYDTAATQWLERTLDDSSNRRLSLPEAFLALDGALDLMHNVASGLEVNEAVVLKNLMEELPFLATENILMEAVKAGGDRQDLHEKIRVHALAAATRVKKEGLDNDLIDRLKGDPAFAAVTDRLNDRDLLDPMNYVGRSVEQTERFVREVVEPLRERYADELKNLDDSEPSV